MLETPNSKTIYLSWYSTVRLLADDTGLDSTSRDYVLHRLSQEGVGFITKTLPKLSKAVLLSLEKGYFVRPFGISWKGASLKYFRVWLDSIFDKNGLVRNTDFSVPLARLRQFCEYFYKLSLPFTKAAKSKEEQKAVHIENEIKAFRPDPIYTNECRKTAENLFGCFWGHTIDDVLKEHRPRFTKGAFSGSTETSYPYYIYKQLPDYIIGTTADRFGAMSGYFKPFPSSDTRVVQVKTRTYSEVCLVPKDSRGPRIISKEPLHILRMQMSCFDWLSSNLERSSRWRINFTNQETNRELARIGSIDRNNATLDLKEASDRVSFKFALGVLRNCPALRWFLLNARSTHTKLPVSRNLIPLNKLSGMGSGLTFPIMALLIHVCVVTSVHKIHRRLSLREISRRVYVYGDDLIIPKEWFDLAVQGLNAAGLMVNNDKSFQHSFFRESCGGDYYMGRDIAPVRLKLSNNGAKVDKMSWYNTGLRLYTDIAKFQLDRHARECSKNGLHSVASYIERKFESIYGDAYDYVYGDSPLMGKWRPGDHISDKKEMRLSAVPITSIDRGTCPYKYLSRFFNSDSDNLQAQTFGEFATPRALKLKISEQPGSVIRGISHISQNTLCKLKSTKQFFCGLK